MSKIPKILIVALILGLIMRGYDFKERYLYAHDGDLASWVVKDIVVDRHLRLIGQLTSEPGIFIGPLFYYTLIPFYLLTGMDPIGGVGFSLTIGLLGVASIYWVMNRIHSRETACFAALIYASSFLISQTEREVVPTTPVMLWTIWFYYLIYRLNLKDKKALVFLAVMFSLVWHINLGLVLLAPLVLYVLFRNRDFYKIADFIKSALVFIGCSAPLWLFELRHGFSQTKALLGSLVSIGSSKSDVISKLSHVTSYAAKNATGIFWDNPFHLALNLSLILLAFGLLFLTVRKIISLHETVIYLLWVLLFFLFFTAHSINLSEYYLNGLNIVWIIITSLVLAAFYKSRLTKLISLLFIGLFIPYNLYLMLTSSINHFGYVEKKALVNFINEDAKAHNYPCVSVSYITNPGYNLGYRYFFYLAGLHVNQPKSGSPVYSIVFPHSLVNRLDRTFGALGLIKPDYERYSPETVKISCSGPDANISDPMFGFTK